MYLRKQMLLPACFLTAASLHAGVITQAELLSGSENVAYAYNGGIGGLTTLSSNVGFGQYGGCAPADNTPGNNSCSISFTGPTDATGKSPKSSDQLNWTISTPYNSALGEPGITLQSSANANADETTGKVGVSASTLSVPVNGINAGGSAQGWSEINDGLHFKVNGATASTVTPILVSYAVNGSLNTGGNPTSETFAELQAILGLGSASFSLTDSELYNQQAAVTNSAGGWANWSVSPNVPGGSFVFQGTYDLVGSTADVGIQEYLYADSDGGGQVDYAHTGTVAFTLPSNVTFTSDSGQFLTAPAVASTPEPASYALLAGGLCALGLYRRKSRRKASC